MKFNKRLIYAKIINFFFFVSFYLNIKLLLKIFFQSYIVKGNNSKLILYLSPLRSKYEINFLIKNKLSLLKLPNIITNEIIIFCLEKNKNIDFTKKHNNNNKKIAFFSKIFNQLNLRLIISPAYHYTYDNYFAKMFHSDSIKYLIFHREGYNYSRNHLRSLNDLIIKYQHNADKILVHNKIYKNLFRKIPNKNSNNIEIIGPLRMKELLKYKKKNQKIRKLKHVLFLSFTPAYSGGNPLKLGKLGQYGRLNKNNIHMIDKIKFNTKFDKFYDYEQFYFAHKIFFECVKENPQIKFKLRLKFNNSYNREIIENFCLKICGTFPKNLKLDEGDIWKSINNSFFVCGYGSTGLLEASFLNIPTIQIINKNLMNKQKNFHNLRISNHINSFKIVKNKKQFVKNLYNLVKKKQNLKEFVLLNKKAKLSFNNFIFNYKTDNNQKFLNIIINLLK